MLERLKEEGTDAAGALPLCVVECLLMDLLIGTEGGADSWARPPLLPIDPKKDSISGRLVEFAPCLSLMPCLVFQQIEVEDIYEGLPSFRVFGVTKVREVDQTASAFGSW